MKDESIFSKYYSKHDFADRYIKEKNETVDVIIPLIHTNELWKINLYSFYKEIPINRLLLGDGGCIDNSINIVRQFPRVKVYDHRNIKTLGYSIKKLIEEVKTEWFIYLHSDVFLPEGWFNEMKAKKSEYDWFGCPMRHTVMIEYTYTDEERPYAGSQMGKKVAFTNLLNNIEDDYIYRQEDFVFANIVEKGGFKHGKVNNTFHYHQVMHKEGKAERKIKKVNISLDIGRKEEIRSNTMQIKGIIKYLDPNPELAARMSYNFMKLIELNVFSWKDYKNYILKTNAKWLPYIKYWRIKLGFILNNILYRNKYIKKIRQIIFKR